MRDKLEFGGSKMVKSKEDKKDRTEGYKVLSKLLDVKLFGGMVPDEAKVIGVLQCEWLSSLHEIKIELTKLTSAFSSSETKTAGTIGKRYFVPYGLYSGGWIYSASRASEFKKIAESPLSVSDLTWFEEGLVNGSSHGRSAMKGFVEPLLIVKVIKDESVKSRYDGLSEDVEVSLNVSSGKDVFGSKDINLKLSKLKQSLKRKEYKNIQVYINESAEGRYKELKDFKKIYGKLEVEETDLNCSWEYVIIYEVKQSNPNGDPDMDNMPRRWEGTDIGIISPERQKRWIRDYLEDMGELIFVTRRGKVQKAKERMKEIENLI
jgi:Cas7 group CRISPR-associated protein Csh2